MKKLKKILILGSGALKIGEAGEFDYSGSQAIKAFKEEGIRTVLINPNIATVQTSEGFADEVYFLPVKPEFVVKVIEKERPDGIALAFGGQTALNCGIALHDSGILKKYNLRVVGTPVETIKLSEDREAFSKFLHSINQPSPASKAAYSKAQAVKIAEKIGLPVMVRAAFTLGGQKSGIAHNASQLNSILNEVFAFTNQVLVEKYLHHYKEIEYEVVRDGADNCITVCNMENFDPLGIHTGESIVVSPSQTLNNEEYHGLRRASMEIARQLGIVGECNVQYAVHPNPENGHLEYYVIEVNARLSRSSALASKATGYPLAYVAAKIGLGKKLSEIQNQVTKKTMSFFEPALDYVVVKIPRWDLEKFQHVDEVIGSSMKSVGEVMGIGRTFEEALQKAIRMLDIGVDGVTDTHLVSVKKGEGLNPATPKRIFAIIEALKTKKSIAHIRAETGIDLWFLYRLKNILDIEYLLTNQRNVFVDVLKKQTQARKNVNVEELLSVIRQAKERGFSDKRIAHIFKTSELSVRTFRKENNIVPSMLKIDTLAGEVPAQTNYLYTTYNASHHDVEPLGDVGVMVLGSGTYRIGSSVEFDWTSVQTAASLSKYHKKSIVVNCNPETVSTDFDMSDRLYFEELTFERLADIYDFEASGGVIVSVGGQTPNNLAPELSDYGMPILGTQAKDIESAENRNIFSALLDDLSIHQPTWEKLSTLQEAVKFAKKVGFPVLVRPSFVLSGSAMRICYSQDDIKKYLKDITQPSNKLTVTISKFIEHAKEIEYDGVAQNGNILAFAISEHVEYAGVHSGDATIMYPPHRIYLHTEQRIKEVATELAKALNLTGPFNIQFVAHNDVVYVIELNVRASRTLPMISKATSVNFPELFVDAIYGNPEPVHIPYPKYAVVKSPQFSFSRLEGADPILRVEMASTGEVATFGDNVNEAFFLSELSVGAVIPKKGIFVSLGGLTNKVRFLESLLLLKKMKIPLYATTRTAAFMKANEMDVTVLGKIHEEHSKKQETILDCFQKGKIDLAINIPDVHQQSDRNDDYVIRRAVVDHNIHLYTDRRKAELFIRALSENSVAGIAAKSMRSYKENA